MSSRLLQKKVFDRREIHNARKLTKIDRLYMHLMQPGDVLLSEEEDEYLNLLKRAFAIMSEGKGQAETIQLIGELEGFDHRMTGWRVIKDAEALFAPMMRINKTLEVAILREKLRLMEERIKMVPEGCTVDEELLLQVYKEWNKLVDKLPEGEVDESLPEIPPLLFTNDPKVLQASEAEIEDDE